MLVNKSFVAPWWLVVIRYSLYLSIPQKVIVILLNVVSLSRGSPFSLILIKSAQSTEKCRGRMKVEMSFVAAHYPTISFLTFFAFTQCHTKPNFT